MTVANALLSCGVSFEKGGNGSGQGHAGDGGGG